MFGLRQWLTRIRVERVRFFQRSITATSRSSISPYSTIGDYFRSLIRSWLFGPTTTMSNFYAVRKGRQVGIYGTWSECEAQVKQFHGAQFKKFKTRSEAQSFIDDGSNSIATAPVSSSSSVMKFNSTAAIAVGKKTTKRKHEATGDGESNAKVDESSTIREDNKRQRAEAAASTTDSQSSFTVVYTDGACTNNGFRGALGGIGVYWGEGDARNVSEPLPPGRQTNNRAEILACAKAIEQARNDGIEQLEIRTDSRFTIDCVTKWLTGWLKKDWKTSAGGPVLNKEELILLNDQISEFKKGGGTIKFVHVNGHCGEPGNEAADRLAVEGIRRQRL